MPPVKTGAFYLNIVPQISVINNLSTLAELPI